ncbi:MAG: hypothetical protein ACI9XO_001499 [Paraglaciecola sp.]|jgi:hypothetical protein
MKKNVLLLAAMFFASMTTFAQLSFSDDFESYTVGDYIGNVSADWTTWSGATGGAEDAQINSDEAASGANSIYFAGQGAGGPQDVVLPFGDKYTEGQFTYSMKVFVPENSTGAYFNLQAEETIGVTWATDIFFRDNGVVDITGGSAGGDPLMSGTYNKGEWVEFEYDINLTANSWTVYVNGDCLGAFENANNSVASIDLFPTAAGVNFYVDDVSFEYNPIASSPVLDLGINDVNLRPNALTGTVKTISGSVKNNGSDMITSFDLTLSDGITNITQPYTGLMIAAGDTYSFSLDEAYTVLEGATAVDISISNVNGTNDDENSCNNLSGTILTGYTPAPGKGVLVEEATGTWCQWCPRGAVFMDLLTDEYGNYFAGIAVHNGDPMVVEEHDAGTSAQVGQSYPNSTVERDGAVDPSGLETPFLTSLTQAPAAFLENGATYDAATGILQLSLATEFQADLSGDYRLNMVIIENGVTGTGSGYNQSNAYAGGGSGPMGGYENLPSPVPASQMVYDHVSRAILGGYLGESGSVPSTVATGETHIINYSIEVSADWDVNNLKVIGFMLNPDGTVDNASETSLAEAIDNGFQMISGIDDPIANSAIKAFPNPFGDELNIALSLEESADVTANLYSITGALLRTQAYGQMNGKNTVSMATYDLPNGIYQLNVAVGNQVIVKKVVLTR